ncbi:uncharacterized protein EV420DRAFT_1483494 [Desarmillaria tabescens]|uniref:Uncharacterized protein n=1 Tax=Armillaria tabescens TaxID=1929756 RepID=A0AA39MW74_ARMTA|nr:uncharacterized protein EV420DRAFT_1483494 [Desarmillaria tabescens]KAK0448488.1 hypothetical protein EV420DRAFT_1483494 [Desarmillaria tabescens]
MWSERSEDQDAMAPTKMMMGPSIPTTSINIKDSTDHNKEILWAEWCKGHTWSKRGVEEVLLLCEEMHRVLKFLAWMLLEDVEPEPESDQEDDEKESSDDSEDNLEASRHKLTCFCPPKKMKFMKKMKNNGVYQDQQKKKMVEKFLKIDPSCPSAVYEHEQSKDDQAEYD